MNQQNNTFRNIRLTIGVAFFSILGIYYGTRGCKEIYNDPTILYTIGTTASTHWSVASGEFINYTYTVNNKAFENENRYMDKCITSGGKYFVAYYRSYPDKARILQNVPVPDSIKIVPDSGWRITDILIGRTKDEVKDIFDNEPSNLKSSDRWAIVMPTIYNGTRGEIDIYFENGKVVKYSIRPV